MKNSTLALIEKNDRRQDWLNAMLYRIEDLMDEMWEDGTDETLEHYKLDLQCKGYEDESAEIDILNDLLWDEVEESEQESHIASMYGLQ